MPNFSRGKIYRISSPSTEFVYIGSTTKKYLSQRFGDHKSDYKRYWEGLASWCYSFMILGYGDATIELIEDYPCSNIDELRKKEREIIEKTPNCCNVALPVLIIDEMEQSLYKSNMAYRKRNKEKVREWNRRGQANYRARLLAKKTAQLLSAPQV